MAEKTSEHAIGEIDSLPNSMKESAILDKEKVYVCKEPFSLRMHDGQKLNNGKRIMVSSGSRWLIDQAKHRVVGGPGSIRLIRLGEFKWWAEIEKENFSIYFEKESTEK